MTLTRSKFLGNVAQFNGGNGIELGGGTSGNVLTRNVAKANTQDCVDKTGVRARPANTWTRMSNVGDTQNRNGLCLTAHTTLPGFP